MIRYDLALKDCQYTILSNEKKIVNHDPLLLNLYIYFMTLKKSKAASNARVKGISQKKDTITLAWGHGIILVEVAESVKIYDDIENCTFYFHEATSSNKVK